MSDADLVARLRESADAFRSIYNIERAKELDAAAERIVQLNTDILGLEYRAEELTQEVGAARLAFENLQFNSACAIERYKRVLREAEAWINDASGDNDRILDRISEVLK